MIMAEQARKGWNPVAKEHVVGIAVGVVATAIFCFIYPGGFMSRSVAEESRRSEGDKVRADYCLNSYLGSGVTAADAAKVRSKGTNEQADVFVNAGHAPTVDAGKACGKALDQLTGEAQLEAAIKTAVAATTARNARLAAARESEAKKN
jgi:hypothetical protein